MARLEEIRSRVGQDGRIQAVRCDCGDSEQVRLLHQEMEMSSFPLCGIVHCAGVLVDGLIENQTHEAFVQVLRPKVSGAQYLHENVSNQALECFVVYSSLAAVVGSA